VKGSNLIRIDNTTLLANGSHSVGYGKPGRVWGTEAKEGKGACVYMFATLYSYSFLPSHLDIILDTGKKCPEHHSRLTFGDGNLH
jgi:hypothetical protein